jgi:hypothetical protein
VITVKVVPDQGEPYRVTVLARDALVWEKTTRDNTFLHFMADMDMVNLYRLAHIASRRSQLFTGDLKAFEDTCDVVFETEEPEPDPTQPGASTGSTSPSPSEQESPRPRGQKKANAQS